MLWYLVFDVLLLDNLPMAALNLQCDLRFAVRTVAALQSAWKSLRRRFANQKTKDMSYIVIFIFNIITYRFCSSTSNMVSLQDSVNQVKQKMETVQYVQVQPFSTKAEAGGDAALGNGDEDGHESSEDDAGEGDEGQGEGDEGHGEGEEGDGEGEEGDGEGEGESDGDAECPTSDDEKTLILGGASPLGDLDGEPYDSSSDAGCAEPAGSNGDKGESLCLVYGAGRMCDGSRCQPCHDALFKTPASKRQRLVEPASEPKHVKPARAAADASWPWLDGLSRS